MKYKHYSISRKLSWLDHLTIVLEGQKVTMKILDWYKKDPCAVIVDNVAQKGPYIAYAVYKNFLRYSCDCEKQRQ
jgi:hypothetical protein